MPAATPCRHLLLAAALALAGAANALVVHAVAAETNESFTPSVGIKLQLLNLPNQGFRYVAFVQNVPMLFDTGSSSLIFCKSAPINIVAVSRAIFQQAYGCDAYGVQPTPSNQPSVYGCASKLYQTSLPLALSGYGNLVLNQSFFKVETTSQGLDSSDFCATPLAGIWGAAGDALNAASLVQPTSFPQCTISGLQFTAFPASFPALVLANGGLFGLLTDFSARAANVFLGTQAAALAQACNLLFVGQLSFTGMNPDQPWAFDFYRASLTACMVGGATVSLPGVSVVFDTGTENVQVPPQLFATFTSLFGDELKSLSGSMSCDFVGPDGNTVSIEFDLGLWASIARDQGVLAVDKSDQFILGLPFFAQFYWLANLSSASMLIYSYSRLCSVDLAKQGIVLTNAPTSVSLTSPSGTNIGSSLANGSSFAINYTVIIASFVIGFAVLMFAVVLLRSIVGKKQRNAPSPPASPSSSQMTAGVVTRPVSAAEPGVFIVRGALLVQSGPPVASEATEVALA